VSFIEPVQCPSEHRWVSKILTARRCHDLIVQWRAEHGSDREWPQGVTPGPRSSS
jgi:hypothetical protein